MAQTTGKEGILMTLSVEGAAVGESQNFNLTLNQEVADLTNRDSARWRQLLPTTRSWSISGDGLYIYTDPGKKVLIDHWETRTPTTITAIVTLADGAFTAQGEAILTSFNWAGPYGDAATITFTLEGTEALDISIS